MAIFKCIDLTSISLKMNLFLPYLTDRETLQNPSAHNYLDKVTLNVIFLNYLSEF